jgi:hypothetical protein
MERVDDPISSHDECDSEMSEKPRPMAVSAIAASEGLKAQKSGGSSSRHGERQQQKGGILQKKKVPASKKDGGDRGESGSPAKKKKKKPDFSKLNRYIRKVIVSECEDLDIDVSISEEACNSINSFAMDKRKQILVKASELLQINESRPLAVPVRTRDPGREDRRGCVREVQI